VKSFLVCIAAGGRRLSVHTIAASSVDALMHVLGSLEALGVPASGGSARPVRSGA